MKFPSACFVILISLAAARAATDLSPAKWGAEERARVEALAQLPVPPAARVIEGKSGSVSATMSPVAVRAGIEALRQGGTAADAAATIALTQISTALGSYVSYAGLMQLTYFEAKTGRTYCMNAGWNSYRDENDPQSIPAAGQPDSAPGRKTMVPGFMAGLEAMHQRFGKLPFAELFSPAIWYAENGVKISPVLASFFATRQTVLSRTEEGRAFLHQVAPDRLPLAGDRFVQAELAKTLREVAQQGARYMYTGKWGRAYVAAVKREGGKITQEDLDSYAPIWETPLQTEFAGHTIYAPGRNSEGGYEILQALNLLEELKTASRGPYWRDPQALLDLSRVLQFAAAGPYVHSAVAASAAASGTTFTLEDRGNRAYAKAALPLLDYVFNPPAKLDVPKHSDAIVVIDQWGNVAAVVHTINTVLWGSTGIVVGGVPLSDAASFQQARLAVTKPGGRIPNEMAPIIATKEGKPDFAVACIGSSLVPETARLVLGALGEHMDPLAVMAAPPLVLNFDFTKRSTIVIPETGYDAEFLKGLHELGVTLETKGQQDVWNLRGTAVIGWLDADNSSRRTVEHPSIFSFAAGY